MITLIDLKNQVTKNFGLYDLVEIIESGVVEFCYTKMIIDFKNRTCENCKYCYTPELTKDIFRCELDVVIIEDSEIELDFGCNKFKPK